MSQRLEKSPQSSAADEDVRTNQRLTELLMANAVRNQQPADAAGVIARPHPVKQAFAIVAVIGLMVVAWAYMALFDRHARQ